MRAVRLHGPGDLRVEDLPDPPPPSAGHVRVRVEVVGICGSDLHVYRTGQIGDTTLAKPVIPGHELAGIVEAVGPGLDGRPDLTPGIRVAVDPAQPCGHCEWCGRGDPNLCPNVKFLGLCPHDGALCRYINVPAETCFAVPHSIDAISAMLLEPLGVALHAMNLGKLRLGETSAVIGCGVIGLMIVRLLATSRAGDVFAAEKLPWRMNAAACTLPETHVAASDLALVDLVQEQTGGRGVDLAFEAAGDESALHSASKILAPGGRLIVVGIDENDRLCLNHGIARRKGLTIKMVRRMKHTYPRSIDLITRGTVVLRDLATHVYPLEEAPRAFAENAGYAPGLIKAAITI